MPSVAPKQQRIKVLAVLAVGQASHPHEDDEPERERQQEQAEVDRERIVDQHAGEDFLPADIANLLDPAGRQRVPERHERPREREPERIDQLVHAQQPHQQHHDDRRANRQLRLEERKARKRVGLQVRYEGLKVHYSTVS